MKCDEQEENTRLIKDSLNRCCSLRIPLVAVVMRSVSAVICHGQQARHPPQIPGLVDAQSLHR